MKSRCKYKVPYLPSTYGTIVHQYKFDQMSINQCSIKRRKCRYNIISGIPTRYGYLSSKNQHKPFENS